MEDGKGDIMVCNTPPSLPPEDRERERGRKEEDEAYVLQFAAIKLCKFAVIRENLSIFAVIKKNVAVITPLGDFDMRPRNYTGFTWELHAVNCFNLSLS